MIAEIHVSPAPAGTPQNRFEHVEAAIEVVMSSGLHHEVGALGTTFEGDADDVWRVLRAAHEAVLRSGADGVITSIRLGDKAVDDDPDGGLRMERLTAKFRS
jgi:uncharacterized protein YqgV (UPF0045/DUF77 family)